MQVVGRLVGLDADERRPDVVDGEDEVVERHVAEGVKEHLASARKEVLPEGPAAADLVLPQAATAIRECRASRGRPGRAEVLARQTLLVDAVARLVQDAEERLVEVMGVVARGDPAIARAGAAAERVRGHVEPAGVEVEADRRSRRLAEDALPIDRVVAFQDLMPWPAGEAAMAATSGTSSWRRAANNSVDLACRGAGLVFVEQRVVGRFLVADGLGFFALEGDDAFELGKEIGKAVVTAGLGPNLLGLRGDAGQLLDQACRQLDRAVVVAADVVDVGGRLGVRLLDQLGAFEVGEQLADARRGQHLMAEARQQGHLLRPMGRALLGHAGPLVPAQHVGA